MDQSLDLVVAYRTLADHGILDAYGHVSVRSAERPDRYLISRALAPEIVRVEDVLEMNLESEPVTPGSHELYSERFIHGEIYKRRPDVNAIVHNHSPTIVPFSITKVPLQPLSAVTSFIGLGVPTFEIRDVQRGADMRILTPLLGRALAGVLDEKPAALMRGHGAVVVAKDLPTVVARCVYLEVAARQLLQARAIAGPGGEIVTLDDSEVAAIQRRQEFSRPWKLFRTKVLRQLAEERGGDPAP